MTDEGLLPQLQDADGAAEYLGESLATGDTARFALALRNVMEVRGGRAALAEALAEQGIPPQLLTDLLAGRRMEEIQTLQRLLAVLDMHLLIESN